MKKSLFISLRAFIARSIYKGDLSKRRELKKSYHLKFRYFQHIVYKMLYGSDLRKLSLAYSTDKWGSHYYADHYNRHFSTLRKKKLNILEIGIGGYDDPMLGGNSLRMWRTYFSKSHIYGIDIYDKSMHDEKNIKTFMGSQIDDDFIDRVLKEVETLDVIIDDGSHVNDHVIYSFNYLFPKLSKNGVYVIEDTQTSYWGKYGGKSDNLNDESTIMGFFKSLIDGLNHSEYKKDTDVINFFDNNIVGMHFYHNVIVIEKGDNLCTDSHYKDD